MRGALYRLSYELPGLVLGLTLGLVSVVFERLRASRAGA